MSIEQISKKGRWWLLKELIVSGRLRSSQTGWPTIFYPSASSECGFLWMDRWYFWNQERRCFGSFPWEQTWVCRPPTWPFKGALCKCKYKCIFTNTNTNRSIQIYKHNCLLQIGVTAALINSNLRLGSLTHCITVGRCKVFRPFLSLRSLSKKLPL